MEGLIHVMHLYSLRGRGRTPVAGQGAEWDRDEWSGGRGAVRYPRHPEEQTDLGNRGVMDRQYRLRVASTNDPLYWQW